MAVRRDDFLMPPRVAFEDWGELDLRRARPVAGREWTDDGEEREDRALKHRADGATRPVPVPPHMVRLLWRHFDLFPDGPADGRLFYGVRSDELPKVTISRAWKKARRDALTVEEVASPLSRRPYDLRHACLSTWLNAGVPAPQVAEWAGHSTKVLLTIYAKCIVGQEDVLRRRIMDALAAA
ncbi:hypothetical protein [Nocardioides speluncae]|uniref:hypothetical protein n=1 Tax=Nocardioides speluncae TaxID=2670337 RepID=UPI003B836B7E